MYKIFVSGYDATFEMLDKANKILNKNGLFLQDIGEKVKDEARNNLQNNTNIDTGALLSSIDILELDDQHVVIGSDLGYAGIIEYGRGEVTPKSAKILHWKDKTSGKDVFSMRSRAVEPSPFLEPAVVKINQEYPAVLARKITDYIQPHSDKMREIT